MALRNHEPRRAVELTSRNCRSARTWRQHCCARVLLSVVDVVPHGTIDGLRMTLHAYQREHKAAIYDAWNSGAQNVMAVLPTGGGKTTVFSDIIKELNRPACLGVHRQELVSQISLALNREHVPHGIIAPKQVIQQTVHLHMDTHGRSSYAARSPIRVASVHTLNARDATDRWYNQVETLVLDEGHHVQKKPV